MSNIKINRKIFLFQKSLKLKEEKKISEIKNE